MYTARLQDDRSHAEQKQGKKKFRKFRLPFVRELIIAIVIRQNFYRLN